MSAIQISELEELIISTTGRNIISSDGQIIKAENVNSTLLGFMDGNKLKGYELLDKYLKENNTILKFGDNVSENYEHDCEITAMAHNRGLITGDRKGNITFWNCHVSRKVSNHAITYILPHKGDIYCGDKLGSTWVKKKDKIIFEKVSRGRKAVKKLLIDGNNLYILNSQLHDDKGTVYDTHVRNFTVLDENIVIAQELGLIKLDGKDLPDSESKPYRSGSRHRSTSYSHLIALGIVTYKGEKHVFGCFEKDGLQVIWNPKTLESHNVLDYFSNDKKTRYYKNCQVMRKPQVLQ